jgi:phospholipase D1/2
LVVEDDDVIDTTMDGQDYQAGRFAATLRRKLWRGREFCFFLSVLSECVSSEHLGLIEPQNCQERHEKVTSFMRPAPIPNEDETELEEDRVVADPLSDQTLALWQDTAKMNRDIFTELFRPVPTNLVQNKEQYKVCFFGTMLCPLPLTVVLELSS